MSRLRQSIGASVANAVQMGLGFVALAVVSRFYPQAEVGVYFYLLGIVVVIDSFVRGFFRAILKREGEYDTDTRELTGLTALIIGISTVGFTGVAFGLEFIRLISHPVAAVLIFIGTVGSRGFLMVLGGQGRVAERAWIEVLRTVLRGSIWVVAAILQLGVIWLALGTAIAGTLVTTITISMLGSPSLPRRNTLNSVWEFARYSIPQTVVGGGFGRLTPVIVGGVIGPAAVGAWTIINRTMLPSMIVPSALGQLTIARSSQQTSRGEDHSKEVRLGTHFSSIFAVPLTFGVLAIGDPVVTTLFGSQYNGLALLAGGIGVAKIFESQSNVLSSGIEGRDDPKEVFRVAVVAVTVGVLGTVIGAITIGLSGVVMAMILTAVVRYLMLIGVSEVSISFGLFNQLVAGLLMGVIVFTLVETVGVPSTLRVFSCVGVGALVYTITIFTIDTEVRNVMIDVSKELRHKIITTYEF